MVTRRSQCRWTLFQKQQQQVFPSLLSGRPSATLAPAPAATTTTTRTKTAAEILRRTMIPYASQDATKNALPIIGNGAYLALASGFLMTDMLQLRLMLGIGYTGLVAFHAFHPKPLQIPLRWSFFFVIINTGAAIFLLMDEWVGALLSDDELALYEEHFKYDGLTEGQFYYLIKLSKQQHIKDESILTQEGRASPNLYFIQKGQAKVFHHGAFAACIDEGGFVNDVAFQQQLQQNEESDEIEDDNIYNRARTASVGAYGTVITHGDCKVLVWDQSELKQYLEKRPAMNRNMKYTLSRQLVKSLLKQREARRRRGTIEEEHDDLNDELQCINVKESNRGIEIHEINETNNKGIAGVII